MALWVRMSIDRRGLTYTSRYIGTHKNLLRLVFCPIYSVVKYRPRQLMLTTPPGRVWIVLQNIRCHIERFHFQPNVRRQATFSNRDTESVVALTPNIKLVELTGIEPVASWLQTRRSPS